MKAKELIKIIIISSILVHFLLAPTMAEDVGIEWSHVADLPGGGRDYGMSAAVVGDEIWLIAGAGSSGPVNTIEVFNTITEQVRTVTSPTELSARISFASSALGNDIYIIGGYIGGYKTNSVQIFDTVNETVADGPSLTVGSAELASAVMSGKIYAIGGGNGSVYNVVQVYEPGSTWQTIGNLIQARKTLDAAVVNGELWALFGQTNTAEVSTIEVYDISSNTWNPYPDLIPGCSNLQTYRMSVGTFTTIVDNKLYTVAGSDRFGVMSDVVEIFDPTLCQWKTGTSFPVPVMRHSTVSVGDTIYVFGGLTSSGKSAAIYKGTVQQQALSYSCMGFESPMDKGPVTVKKNRALPLKAQIMDANGLTITDQDVSSPPVIQVLYDSGTGGDPVDVTDDALSVGEGTEGNQFEFTDEGKWQFNLKIKNYTASGMYLIYMESGDETEYTIEQTCEASFIVK